MASFNSVVLMGNIGRDPEIKTIKDAASGRETKMARFSLATTEGWGDNAKTNWHNIVAWGNNAEVIEKYVAKGSSLTVQGTLGYTSYTDKDGHDRTSAQIRAERIVLMSKKTDAPAAAPAASAANEDSSNDLPF